jgi:hypothetical protein
MGPETDSPFLGPHFYALILLWLDFPSFLRCFNGCKCCVFSVSCINASSLCAAASACYNKFSGKTSLPSNQLICGRLSCFSVALRAYALAIDTAISFEVIEDFLKGPYSPFSIYFRKNFLKKY